MQALSFPVTLYLLALLNGLRITRPRVIFCAVLYVCCDRYQSSLTAAFLSLPFSLCFACYCCYYTLLTKNKFDLI